MITSLAGGIALREICRRMFAGSDRDDASDLEVSRRVMHCTWRDDWIMRTDLQSSLSTVRYLSALLGRLTRLFYRD